LSVDSALR